ncbi:hypothetical protein D6D29_01873 [Aureobasidium pullulans]|nr:hypothetical protein D6D29_01873 [Aureobasidium pullulans]
MACMEPLAAMAKQLASALNQAAKSFASVKKELAETKAALAQTQKKSLDDKIALIQIQMDHCRANMKQAHEIISLINEIHDEAGHRHNITINTTHYNPMESVRYHSTTEHKENMFRWLNEYEEAASELDELLLQLGKIGPIIETEPESA